MYLEVVDKEALASAFAGKKNLSQKQKKTLQKQQAAKEGKDGKKGKGAAEMSGASSDAKRATQWEQTKAMSAANENFKAGKYQDAYEGYGACV